MTDKNNRTGGMTYRNPIAVWLLPSFTLLIYFFVWMVSTKNEMKRRGAAIPTAWLWIVPFGGIYWTWKYSKGVELVTKGKMSTGFAFCIFMFLGAVGAAIIQNEFNKVTE